MSDIYVGKKQGENKMKYYVTGDCHGDFKKIEYFCKYNNTSKKDVLVILGDAGINYWLNKSDIKNKIKLEKLPITIFVVHGNHEERPCNIASYKEKIWNGGTVYYEEDYPSLLFAMDGEVYDMNGKKAIAIGGAYSVDKDYRCMVGMPWFSDEQPSDAVKESVERKLQDKGWKIDYILSHTCPKEMMPTDLFLDFIDQNTVDNSTEEWLGKIWSKTDFERWYFGHFHENRIVGDFYMLYEAIYELGGGLAQLVGVHKYSKGDIILFTDAHGNEIPGKIRAVYEYGNEKQHCEVSYDIQGVIDGVLYEGIRESSIELVESCASK